MSNPDRTEWTREHEVVLRQRLEVLANEDPVEEGWETIRDQIAAKRSRPRIPRPITVAVAASIVLVFGVYAFAIRADDAIVETVDDTTTSLAPRPSTTAMTPEPGATDSSTPSTAVGPSREDREDQPDRPPPDDRPNPPADDGVDAGSGTGTGPRAAVPGTTAPESPGVSPLWEMSVSPASPIQGDTVTVSAVTPCVAPPTWPQEVLVLVEYRFPGGGWREIATMTESGMWTWAIETSTSFAPGDREIRAECEAYNPQTNNLEVVGTYAPETFMLTAA